MKKNAAIPCLIFLIIFPFGCQKSIPVQRIQRPDSLFYLKQSVELHEQGKAEEAKIYFSVFLRFHDFKEEEIYHPETLTEERYASLLEEILRGPREKYSLSPGLLKAIHAGKKTGEIVPEQPRKAASQSQKPREPSVGGEDPLAETEKQETGHGESSSLGKSIDPPPEVESRPTAEAPAFPEAVGPEPDSRKEKVFVRERQTDPRPGRLQRLSGQRAKDKELLFKTAAPLSTEEVMDAFGLASRPGNVSRSPEGFRIRLPFSAQHLGGMVGKKAREPYVANQGGETLDRVITNVKELVPRLCGKRAYRCTIFEKLHARGKIADTYSEARKKIYLWNKGVLKDYPFEELMEGKVKIKGGTQLHIFTDFFYGDL